jgi:hypothetical protein
VSIDRQFGVHEIPGTEEPAPTRRPETVSAGFESQMRNFINQIWSKLAEHDEKLAEISSQGRPMLVSDDDGAATGEGFSHSPPKPRPGKPWQAEGVSKATWYRRHKEAAP